MDFTDFQATISNLLVATDSNGQALLAPLWTPMIAFAEGIIYRDGDLDFLVTRAVDLSQATQNGARAVPIPPQFIVVEAVSLVLPAVPAVNQGPAPPLRGATRVPLLRATRQFCDLIWPVESQVQTPDPLNGGYYALFSEQEAAGSGAEADELKPLPSSIIVAPTPDAAYPVEFTGTIRPAPLSAENPTTFLTEYLPDLFVTAAMIWAAGAYLRNFGSQADNPQQAVSWKQLYAEQKAGAAVEEARKKAQGRGWTSFPAAPIAQPPRPRTPAPPGTS